MFGKLLAEDLQIVVRIRRKVELLDKVAPQSPAVGRSTIRDVASAEAEPGAQEQNRGLGIELFNYVSIMRHHSSIYETVCQVAGN